MKKSRVWQAIVPGTQTEPQDALRIRKTPWDGVTKQPPAVPLPPNATPERNEKIKARHRNLCTEHQRHFELGCWQAIPLDTLQIRKTPWRGVTKQPPAIPLPGPNATPEPNEKSLLPSLCRGQTSLLNRMKKSRVWQAIVPGTQNKPQDTLQIRKTPWHGVTKQPPAVPLPGPNVTPEPNEKIKGLAGNCSRHTKQATRHPSNQENTLARRDETASCRPSARVKGSGRQLFTQNKPQETLQIRKTPWHGVTKQPPAVPLPGPNVTPEPNEKINQGSGRQLFQANKKSHKTPFKSGKHPGTA